jgi:hypothetical protein
MRLRLPFNDFRDRHCVEVGVRNADECLTGEKFRSIQRFWTRGLARLFNRDRGGWRGLKGKIFSVAAGNDDA